MKNNVFEILRVKREEQPHDLVIEWLCDGGRGHGVADFAGSVIEHLWGLPFREPVVSVKRQCSLASDCRPDLVVEFETGLLVVENKVNAGAMRAGQLDRQHELAAARQAGRPLFHVLLCPDRLPVDGYALVSEAFRVLRYSELATLLTAAATGAADGDAKAIIGQYAAYVRDQYGTSQPSAIRLASSHKILSRNTPERVDSREKFLKQVEAFDSPSLLLAQEALLDLFLMMDSVDAGRFDSEGKTHALYRVYFAGTDEHILRVYADGRIMVYLDALSGRSHLHRPELARELAARLVAIGLLDADKQEACAPSLRKDKNLQTLSKDEIEAFAVALQTVADKLAAMPHGEVAS